MNDTTQVNISGNPKIGQMAVGSTAKIINHPSRPPRRGKGIGVVTIKAAESRAVAEVFGLTGERDDRTGQRFSGNGEILDEPVEFLWIHVLEKVVVDLQRRRAGASAADRAVL